MNHTETKRSILIVEDNDINREMLRDFLEDDYNIFEACDGIEGLEQMKEHYRTISLVLLDVQMPRMNGYQFLEVYKQSPLYTDIPVIVTTGSTLTSDEEKCLTLGANDFVTKPYKPNIIMRRMESAIRLHESAATLQAVEFDALSGLYSRGAFQHHVKSLLEQNEHISYSMILLNIEDFGYYNERFGEAAGDRLLRCIGEGARRISDYLVCMSRFSGDRFMFMYETARSEDVKREYADFINYVKENAPKSEFTLKSALFEDFDRSLAVSLIYDRLVMALNTIRHDYTSYYTYYTKEMSEKQQRMFLIENCMEQALKEKQFLVYYQPKHDPATGKLCGAEALVRWIHPTYGFMSPGDFIPLFEKNGFITRLDSYMWRRVAEDQARWQSMGIDLVPISVNASRRDFITLDSMDVFAKALEDNGLDKKFMHLEVTESSFADNEIVLKRLQEVHDLGFKIELDDFGSGYSSLGTLHDIPMDVMKLDMSFIRALDKQHDVVKIMIELAHALGYKTVAEGVESADQVETLRGMGCDAIQGYYYSRPLPMKDFEAYLQDPDKR